MRFQLSRGLGHVKHLLPPLGRFPPRELVQLASDADCALIGWNSESVSLMLSVRTLTHWRINLHPPCLLTVSHTPTNILAVVIFAKLSLHDTGSRRRNLRPEVSTLLGNWASDGRTLHFSLGVNNHTRIVLKVNESSFPSSPRLSLSNYDGLQNLLPELGLTLLNRNHHHISNRRTGQTIQPGTDSLDGDDIKVFTTAVVGTIDKRSDSQTKGNSKLRTTRTSTYERDRQWRYYRISIPLFPI